MPWKCGKVPTFVNNPNISKVFLYSYNKGQQDSLLPNFILVKNSTCFGQTYCPSSGVLILYSQMSNIKIPFRKKSKAAECTSGLTATIVSKITCHPVSLLPKNVKIKLHRTITLHVVVYGCETWSLTRRQERRLRALVDLLVYFCLPNIINPMYIQYLGEIVPPPSQNTVGVCNLITFLIIPIYLF